MGRGDRRAASSQLERSPTAGNQKALAFLRAAGTVSAAALVAQFLAGFGAPAPVTFELFGDDVLRRANALSFGREQLPTFDLANARFVLSFGADFLGTWNSPVAQAAATARCGRAAPAFAATFVQVESRMSQTGANADEWVPVTPGTEGVLALGLAHVILATSCAPPTSRPRRRAHRRLVGGPRRLHAGAGREDHRRRRRDASNASRAQFAERSPAVAMIGGAPLAHTNGLFTRSRSTR